MSCLHVYYPSTTPSLGFGSGGLGGASDFLPFSATIHPSGLEVAAQIGKVALTSPGPRIFIIAGIEQVTIAAGSVTLPTSDDVPVGPYAVGSSQYYTVGQVQWNNQVAVKDHDWKSVPRLPHIVQILANPATIHTAIRLIYYRWDIGVRAGFEVTSYPISFAFQDTSILAERVPPANQFFTVTYLCARHGNNPSSMFARYPMMVDDVLTDHTLYDGNNGFQTYRPVGYRVFNTVLRLPFLWDGTSWDRAGAFAAGTMFYVKNKRAIYQFDGVNTTRVYNAGDPLTPAIPEVLAYPVQPLPTELYGESIGKNFIADAFSANASSKYPSAYMIAQRPGDYDDSGPV